MPEISRTTIENRIKEANPGIAPSDLRRAYKLHKRRHDAHLNLPTHEDALLLVKATTYADPVGNEAVHNVLREAA